MSSTPPQFVRNPLTGRNGIYAPMPHDVPPGRRPLAYVAAAVLEDPCALCAKVVGAEPPLIVDQPNDAPLGPGHTLLTWKRHIVAPRDATPREWQALLERVEALMDTLDNPVGYGNLGVHSGASQHHLHAHVLEGPTESDLEHFPQDACPICAGSCPQVLSNGPWSLQYVPGGRHAELIAVHEQHTNQNTDLDALAELLESMFTRFAAAGWDSTRMFWHRPGHAHIHIQPCITADGALEAGGQISVSRYGYEHVTRVLHA